MAGRLNVDIPGKAAEFESLMDRIFPRKIYYKLLLRGKGLEFDGYRKLGPEEDSGSIDWKASIRAGGDGSILLAKQYIEERDLRIIFIIDVGDNMIFGSAEKLKCEYCAEMAGSLSNVMINAGDQIGFFLFNHDIISMQPSKSGEKQFNLFSYELSNAGNYGGISDFKTSLNNLLGLLDPSVMLVVFISDFIKVNEEHVRLFENLGGLVETVALIVRDPLDKTLPNINKEIVIQDVDGGEKLLINPKIAKKIYEENAKKQLELTKQIFRDSNIDFLELDSSEDFCYPLAMFLKRRAERR